MNTGDGARAVSLRDGWAMFASQARPLAPLCATMLVWRPEYIAKRDLYIYETNINVYFIYVPARWRLYARLCWYGRLFVLEGVAFIGVQGAT